MSEDTPQHDITRLMQTAGSDPVAANQLLEEVYGQLKAIARRLMSGERSDHTLQATALVHEAYIRLLGRAAIGLGDRASFFRAAAEAMRRILVEHARRRGRLKRGGQRRRVSLDAINLADEENCDAILAVDEALRRLEKEDEASAEIVRLRFFAGLSVDEVSAVLKLSPRTVARDWAYARAWLYRALSNEPD